MEDNEIQVTAVTCTCQAIPVEMEMSLFVSDKVRVKVFTGR